MGMFDYFYVNLNLLPISDEEKVKLGENPNWQTKDFDNDLTEVYLTDDGSLEISRWELESVPKEERPYPNGEGIYEFMGSLRRINERRENLNFHGFCTFYTLTKDKTWFEFECKFTDGKLITIKRI